MLWLFVLVAFGLLFTAFAHLKLGENAAQNDTFYARNATQTPFWLTQNALNLAILNAQNLGLNSINSAKFSPEIQPNLSKFSAQIHPNLANFFPKQNAQSIDFKDLTLFAFNESSDFFTPFVDDYFDFFAPNFAPKDKFNKPSKPEKSPQKPKISLQEPLEISQKSAISSGTKPKLAIIIDDMATREQVNALKATKLKLTPSFFPPDSTHPQTPILAREFEFFMVHLPLEARNFRDEELQTLYTSDTLDYIEDEIVRIKRAFGGVKFINNHTGSLFTSDTSAMRRLFRVLRAQGLIFVDSRTSGSSKAALVAREFNQTPIKRDIFLDNEPQIPAIRAKIAEAVQIARKNGFAIAIAHPKRSTFRALAQSADLFEGVELVYVSEIYESP